MYCHTPWMSEYRRTLSVPEVVGIPVTVLLVPVTVPPKMFEEPAPVVPTCKSYCVTCDPVVHENVAEERASLLPGVGDDMAAGAAGLASVKV